MKYNLKILDIAFYVSNFFGVLLCGSAQAQNFVVFANKNEKGEGLVCLIYKRKVCIIGNWIRSIIYLVSKGACAYTGQDIQRQIEWRTLMPQSYCEDNETNFYKFGTKVYRHGRIQQRHIQKKRETFICTDKERQQEILLTNRQRP